MGPIRKKCLHLQRLASRTRKIPCFPDPPHRWLCPRPVLCLRYETHLPSSSPCRPPLSDWRRPAWLVLQTTCSTRRRRTSVGRAGWRRRRASAGRATKGGWLATDECRAGWQRRASAEGRLGWLAAMGERRAGRRRTSWLDGGGGRALAGRASRGGRRAPCGRVPSGSHTSDGAASSGYTEVREYSDIGGAGVHRLLRETL
jgi:hypothetical protein